MSVSTFDPIRLSTANSYDWSPVISGDYGAWIAQYNGSQSMPVTKWSVVAFRQWTDIAKVNGISGLVDGDVFYGTKEELLKYGYTAPVISKPAESVPVSSPPQSTPEPTTPTTSTTSTTSVEPTVTPTVTPTTTSDTLVTTEHTTVKSSPSITSSSTLPNKKENPAPINWYSEIFNYILDLIHSIFS